VLRRSKLPPPAAARVYELTDWGKELEPVVVALGRWGSRGPFPETDNPLGVDALIIALKTVFDPTAADGTDAVVQLTFGEHHFRATVTGGRLDIVRGAARDPQATIEADPATLAAVLWHGRPLTDGSVKLHGDRRSIRRFLGLFPAPQPADGG
jgi:hypothetical protein